MRCSSAGGACEVLPRQVVQAAGTRIHTPNSKRNWCLKPFVQMVRTEKTKEADGYNSTGGPRLTGRLNHLERRE